MIAATSGISGYIDANGHIVQQTAQFTPAVVTADVTPRTGQTLAIRLGAAPEWAMMILGLLAWAWAAANGRRRRRLEAAFAAPEPAPSTVPAASATVGAGGEGLLNGAVTASPAQAATVNEAAAETVSSLPAAPAAHAIVSNARRAHR